MRNLTKKKSVRDSQNWDQKVNVVKTRDQEALEAGRLAEMKTGVETIETIITKNQDPNVNLRLKLQENLRKNSMVKTLNRSQLSEKTLARARQALPA